MPERFFLARLKERKLVQWAVAYVAGARVVLQVMDVVARSLKGPKHPGLELAGPGRRLAVRAC